MADPISIATVGMGMSAGGGIMGAIGSIFGGEASKSMYDYQAGVAEMNKKIAMQNSAYERQAGDLAALKEGLQGRYRMGQIKSAQSGSGFDMDRGTATKVVQSQQEITEMDQKFIEMNAARRAYGYKVEAVNLEAQKNIDIMAGKNAEVAGFIGAGSSLLGAGGKVASQWYQASQQFGAGMNPGFAMG